MRRDIFTIPNVFSLARIFLAIPIFYFIANHKTQLAISFILVAFVTDWLDGYLARKLDQISDIGKILDPVADKICTTSGFIGLSIYYNFPVWLTIIIISRDILISIGSILIIGKRKIILPSNKPGKITVFFITLLGLFYLLEVDFINLPLIIIVIILIIISIFNYTRIFRQNIGSQNET